MEIIIVNKNIDALDVDHSITVGTSCRSVIAPVVDQEKSGYKENLQYENGYLSFFSHSRSPHNNVFSSDT